MSLSDARISNYKKQLAGGAAYRWGFNYWLAGEELSGNPFGVGTLQYYAFRRGWLVAFENSKLAAKVVF